MVITRFTCAGEKSFCGSGDLGALQLYHKGYLSLRTDYSFLRRSLPSITRFLSYFPQSPQPFPASLGLPRLRPAAILMAESN